MHAYAIYRHPVGTIVTLKTGWNWYTFFLSFAWFAQKRLWGKAFRTAIALAGTFFLYKMATSLAVALDHSTVTDLYTTMLLWALRTSVWVSAILTALWMLVYAPFRAHTWYSAHLLRSGYTLVDTVKAHNGEGALAAWLLRVPAAENPAV